MFQKSVLEAQAVLEAIKKRSRDDLVGYRSLLISLLLMSDVEMCKACFRNTHWR